MESGETRRANRHSKSVRILSIGWKPPPSSVVKVNIDGAAKGNLRVEGVGCVFYDQSGLQLIGRARSLGCYTSFLVELWAAMTGH